MINPKRYNQTMKPLLWLSASFILAFTVNLGRFTPEFMALAVGALVFARPRPGLWLIFVFGFLSDLAFQKPFGFYPLIFLILIWLAAHYRYRFFLANPLLRGVSIFLVIAFIKSYEACIMHLTGLTIEWPDLLSTGLATCVLWPVYASLSWNLRSVGPLHSDE